MSAGWKAFEARIAARFGLRRRGAATSRRGDGLSDACREDGSDSPHWAIECKLLGRPSFQQLLDAARQAEAAAEGVRTGHPTPLAIVKRKNDHDANALVVMRLEPWLEWYGPATDTIEGIDGSGTKGGEIIQGEIDVFGVPSVQRQSEVPDDAA